MSSHTNNRRNEYNIKVAYYFINNKSLEHEFGTFEHRRKSTKNFLEGGGNNSLKIR